MNAASEARGWFVGVGDVVGPDMLDAVPVGRLIVSIGEGGGQIWVRSVAGWSRPTTGQRGVASADLPALSWRLVHG